MRCFLASFRKELHCAGLYRFDFALRIAYSLIAMYGYRCLWTALYAQNPAVAGRDLPSMITYAMLAALLGLLFNPFDRAAAPHQYLADQIRTGAISSDLLRPMNLQNQLLMRSASSVLFTLLALALPAWALGVGLPASPLCAAGFFCSLALGYVVSFSLNFLLGLICFVTLDIRSVVFAYVGVTRIFSGELIPFELFPDWLRPLCRALPFQYMASAPLNIYTGQYAPPEMLRVLAMEACWAAALLAAGRLLWRAVHRRLIVQGG
ncbi:MAG: ABC-2 family transporter protein [Eubacteriales bacterium]|nr:ABC-2 family transporter protein [Eubacteriales bacterium]